MTGRGLRLRRTARRTARRSTDRVWRDFRFKDLYRSSKEFELMHRALGFAALAILTLIPLLILIAAATPTPHRGVAGWVVYGMGLTGSSATAVTRLFATPARVLSTTSVFSALVLSFSGIAFAGSVQAGFEKVWGLAVGPWHKIWRQAVWLVLLVVYIYAAATVGTVTNGGVAETAGRVAVAVVLGVTFFWWGLRFLIGGRVSYLAATPGAVATIVGLAGLRAFSGLVFEPLIARNAVSYGPLGTVLIVTSWLIGVGWVVYAGQLAGRWFHDAWLLAWMQRRRGRQDASDQPPGPLAKTELRLVAAGDHRQQHHRVVVAGAGLGLVDGHTLTVGEEEHLVGQGELADPRVAERLGLTAPLPYVVPLPQPGELLTRVEQLGDQCRNVRVVRVAGLQRMQVGGRCLGGVLPVGEQLLSRGVKERVADRVPPLGGPVGEAGVKNEGLRVGGEQVAGTGEHVRRAGPHRLE
jgi:membrane protein